MFGPEYLMCQTILSEILDEAKNQIDLSEDAVRDIVEQYLPEILEVSGIDQDSDEADAELEAWVEDVFENLP